MASYISETGLRELLVDFIRMTARSATDVRIELIPGPFRPGNWRVVWIDVLAEDYSEARDVADDLESRRDWVMVPDGHPLAGQVLGKEYDHSWPINRPAAEPFGAAECDPGHGGPDRRKSFAFSGSGRLPRLWHSVLQAVGVRTWRFRASG